MSAGHLETQPSYGEGTRWKNLYQYLTHPDPPLFVSNSWVKAKKYSSTNSPAEGNGPKKVMHWRGFPFDQTKPEWREWIEEALYAERNAAILSDYTAIDPFPCCRVYDEHSLEAVLSRWTQSVVCRGLQVAQATLDSGWPFRRTYMARGGVAQVVSHDRDGKEVLHQDMSPDWSTIQRHPEEWRRTGQYRNIMPGDTKLNRKFSSKALEDWNTIDTRNPKLPVIQIYNYCFSGEARYGYIITDGELIAVRLTRATETLEWFAVPWQPKQADQSGKRVQTSKMTVNLALWYLHLLATLETTPHTGSPKDWAASQSTEKQPSQSVKSSSRSQSSSNKSSSPSPPRSSPSGHSNPASGCTPSPFPPGSRSLQSSLSPIPSSIDSARNTQPSLSPYPPSHSGGPSPHGNTSINIRGGRDQPRSPIPPSKGDKRPKESSSSSGPSGPSDSSEDGGKKSGGGKSGGGNSGGGKSGGGKSGGGKSGEGKKKSKFF